MKLSVVIPVYRVADTLDRCVESVLAQDVPDMEIWLIDDGSTDQCPQMCDEWAAREPQRIHVIHQKNGGLSAARNTGIEAARGDILTFVDSDDYLAAGTYAPLLQAMAEHPEYDIMEFSCTAAALTDHVYDNMTDYWLKGQAYQHTYAWNKLYRRTLFDDVRFPVGRVFEDAYTLPRLLEHARCVATMQQGLYHYTDNPEGICRTAGGTQLTQMVEAQQLVLNRLRPLRGEAMEQYYLYALNRQMECYAKGGSIVLGKYWGSMHLSTRHTWEENVKIAILNILGIKNLCKIYKLMEEHLLRRW